MDRSEFDQDVHISRVRDCLQDDQSKQALNEYLSQDALDMLYHKFVGRYLLLPDKHKGVRRDKSVKTVLDILAFYFYRRCFWGENTLEIDSVNAALVERAFGRIKVVNCNAALQNFFTATDPGFQVALRELMDRTQAAAQGNLFEQHMMSVFSETLKSRRLSDWPHLPRISEMCPDLVGEVEIVGWREPALLKGTTYELMSMGEFMDAHVNHQSIRDKMPVPPFFFPKSKPSGPDLGMKLRHSSVKLYNSLWKNALATVSAPCIREHADDFHNFCPDNIYISMVVAYPMVYSPGLPPVVDIPEKDASGVQQVVIHVSDANFGQIFPKEHV
ncbi:hypothetical protein BGZ70_008520, partial [Mortierella alpina]